MALGKKHPDLCWVETEGETRLRSMTRDQLSWVEFQLTLRLQ